MSMELRPPGGLDMNVRPVPSRQRLVNAATALTSRWNVISPTSQETPLALSELQNTNPALDILLLQEEWFLATEKYLILCVDILKVALVYNMGIERMRRGLHAALQYYYSICSFKPRPLTASESRSLEVTCLRT